MRLTPARHTALARLSDGEWYTRPADPGVLGVLYRNGMIRCDREDVPMYERLWTITPSGLAALKEAGG